MASGKPRRYSKNRLTGIISSQAAERLKVQRLDGSGGNLKVKSSPTVMLSVARQVSPVVCDIDRSTETVNISVGFMIIKKTRSL